MLTAISGNTPVCSMALLARVPFSIFLRSSSYIFRNLLLSVQSPRIPRALHNGIPDPVITAIC